jgi:hypothetical protein
MEEWKYRSRQSAREVDYDGWTSVLGAPDLNSGHGTAYCDLRFFCVFSRSLQANAWIEPHPSIFFFAFIIISWMLYGPGYENTLK